MLAGNVDVSTESPGGLLDGYLSRDQLAAQLQVSTDTLTRWHTQRVGPPSVFIGRRRFYRRDAVAEWMKEREARFAGGRS